MSIGSPLPFNNLNVLQPTVDEKNSTAASELAKMSSNLSMDSMVSFTKLSEHSLFKYDVPSQQPKLTSPLQIRTAGAEVTDDSEAINSNINALIKSLPPAIQEKLAEFKALSSDKKNPDSFDNYDGWNALNKLIEFSAMAQTFIATSVVSLNSEKALEMERFNSEIPNKVAEGMAKDLELIAESFKEDLKNRINNPQNDAVRYIITEFELLLTQVPEALQKTPQKAP